MFPDQDVAEKKPFFANLTSKFKYDINYSLPRLWSCFFIVGIVGKYSFNGPWKKATRFQIIVSFYCTFKIRSFILFFKLSFEKHISDYSVYVLCKCFCNSSALKGMLMGTHKLWRSLYSKNTLIIYLTQTYHDLALLLTSRACLTRARHRQED